MKRSIAAISLLLVFACTPKTTAPQSDKLDDGTPTLLRETVSGFEGKAVVVNFWATWCAPCKAEMPRIVAAARKYADDVRFVGVDVQDDAKAAGEFIEAYDMPFRSLSDRDGEIRRAEKIAGLPVTQFYDASGELAFMHNGEIKTKDLERKIEDTLSAASAGDPEG